MDWFTMPHKDGYTFAVKFANGAVQRRTRVFESIEAAAAAMHECQKITARNMALGITLRGTNIHVPLFRAKPGTAGRNRDEREQLFEPVPIIEEAALDSI